MTRTDTFRLMARNSDHALDIARSIATENGYNLTHVHWIRLTDSTEPGPLAEYTIDAELTPMGGAA